MRWGEDTPSSNLTQFSDMLWGLLTSNGLWQFSTSSTGPTVALRIVHVILMRTPLKILQIVPLLVVIQMASMGLPQRRRTLER